MLANRGKLQHLPLQKPFDVTTCFVRVIMNFMTKRSRNNTDMTPTRAEFCSSVTGSSIVTVTFSSPVQRSVAWIALVSRTLFQIQDLESIFNLEICCTWCSSAKRENFKYFHFFMFLSCHSNYKNIARIAHSHCKKITRKSILERTLDYDEF